MKQIDGIDEDVWFERTSADILERMSARMKDGAVPSFDPQDVGAVVWLDFIRESLDPLRPRIAAVIDPETADVADSIVAYTIMGALNEANGDVPSAIAFLRE